MYFGQTGMRRFNAWVTPVGVAILVATLVGGDERRADAQPTRAEAMEMKLTLTQELLEKITLEEFDDIATISDVLFKVSVDATWAAPRAKEYDLFANDFFYRAVQMEDAAKAKNLEAVTLHYTNLIRTCVECHQVVRKQQNLALVVQR